MDNLAPAHTGCQEFHWASVVSHYDKDSHISPEQFSEAVQKARTLFRETFSYPGELWGINQFDLLEIFWKQFEHVDVQLRFIGVVEEK